MTVRIALGSRAGARRDTVRTLARALDRAARRAGLDAGERAMLGVRIVGDREMARINREHRGVRGPTDVLSFAYAAEAPLADGNGMTLGDLLIDWHEVARRDRSERGRGLEAAQLAVHGLAHLLGHDHGRAAQARRMLRCERTLARAAGIPAPVRPYDRRRERAR